MKVSISKAATMAGVTRATFYRHIEKKGITVEKDSAGNPQIDVSELIRIYGDKVRSPEQVEKDKMKQQASRQSGNADQELRVEVEVLRERLKSIESERMRERDQLCGHIDLLKKSLEKAQEQSGRLTAMLTDQRTVRNDNSIQVKRMSELEMQITRLQESQKRLLDQVSGSSGGFWSIIRKKAA